MFHRAIISGMVVSHEDLAAGALALQVFVKNAKYVEIIVNVAFATIPSILGIGAAGLIGSGIINTARDVKNSISLLRTVGPMVGLGWMAGKAMVGLGGMGAKELNTLRKGAAERLKQYNHPAPKLIGNALTPIQWVKSKRKKNNQDSQGKQEEQSSGGSGGSPPTPPDIKPTQQEEQSSGGGSPPTPPDIKPTQDKQKEQGGEGRKIILPGDLLKSGELSLEDYLKLQKKLEK